MATPNMNKAGLASALDKATTGLTQGLMTRDQAQLAKTKAQSEMKTIKYQDETDAVRNEIDTLNAKNKETSAALTREKTFRALKYFSTDGNVRHLNSTLKDESMKSSGIIRFSPITLSVDSNLIAQSGMDESDFSDEQQDAKRFVKGIMQDGSEKIFDVYQYKQATGYYKNLTDQEIAEELAKNKVRGKGSKDYSPSEMEKIAKYAESQGIDSEAGAAASLFKDRIQGNVAGNLDAAEKTTEELNKQFSGDFLNSYDPTSEQAKIKAYPLIARIEAARGVKWSPSQMSNLEDISALIGLGDPASGITDEETGIIDSLTYDVKKYVSEDGGSESVAAYAAFRNSLRHALYGSALTPTEVESFNEQFGTRRQKLGPLLKQMKVAYQQVQHKLQTIYDMNDPYVATYRLGVSPQKIAKIIDAMNKNIATLSNMEKNPSGKSKEQTDKDAISKAFGAKK